MTRSWIKPRASQDPDKLQHIFNHRPCLCPDAVTNVQADHNTKLVTVTSTLSSDEILKQLEKTGKEIKFLGVKK